MAKKCDICGKETNENMWCEYCKIPVISHEMYIDIKSISQKMTDAFYRNGQTIDEIFKQEYQAQFLSSEKAFEQEYYNNPKISHDCTYAEIIASKREYESKQNNWYEKYLTIKREETEKSAKEKARLEKLRQELDIVLD